MSRAAQETGWLRYLAHRCLAHPRLVAGAAIGAVGAALLSAALPLIVRHVVDSLTGTASSVMPWVALLLGLGLARFGASFVRRVSSSQLSLGVQHDLRRDLFAALLRLDGLAQARLQTGQVVSRAITDVTLIQMFLQLLPIVSGNVALLVVVLVLMTFMSPPLTVIALLVVPALWFITRRGQRVLFPANWDTQAGSAEVAMRVEAAVAGVRVVKGFGQEQHELDGLAGAARDLYRSRLRLNRLTSRFTPAMQAVPALGQALVLVVGGLLALDQSVSLGTFLAFMTYLGAFVTPVRQFSMLLTVSQQGRASLDRVREVIEAPVPPAPPAPSGPPPSTPPSVEFRGVRFGFDGTPVLDGVDLTVPSGQTVAIAGGAGSGKSVLVHLIPRLFDPDAGAVLFDGVDVRALPDVRAQVAMVFEDTHLMADSVRANVAYGDPDADDDRVWHALYLAAADGFVRELPDGLDTRIGERGQRLSGGQRQRIALARALLTDAPVLVLDDATSAIDARVEEEIFARIGGEVRRRTTVVVAHRMSTLALADTVAVLDGGRIAESGTLEGLRQSGELFRALFTPPEVDGIGAGQAAARPGRTTAPLWIEPADTDDDAGARALEQAATAFAQRAAGAPTGLGRGAVDNIEVTQAYRREARNQAEFERRSWAYRTARLRSQVLMAVFFPLIELMSVCATAGVLAVGVHQVRVDALTVGTLIAFLLYIDLLFAPIQQLSQVFDSYQQAVVGVDRLGELFRTEVTTPDHPEARAVTGLRGDIELRGMGFAYEPGGGSVLAGVDLRIAAGQTVALVGETGAGKSTLVKLIARYYDPTEGAVLVDGTDLRHYRLRDFRKRLGVVPQEPFLFGDTVRSAVAYGRPEATPADIEWAARAVGAHEMIAALEHGYYQPIGEHGRNLSAGQRQLLALARAQLVEPDILILDEATASLDLATEARVRAAVDVLTAGRTTIVVAHRLATAADADLIAVVGAGRLVQVGTHAELLSEEGPYRDLWAAYVGDGRESAEGEGRAPARL